MPRVLLWVAIPPISRALILSNGVGRDIDLGRWMRGPRLDDGRSFKIVCTLSGRTAVFNHDFNGFGSDFLAVKFWL